jgi:hypothetical protein
MMEPYNQTCVFDVASSLVPLPMPKEEERSEIAAST